MKTKMYRRGIVAVILFLALAALAACTSLDDKFNSTELASAEIGLEGGTVTADVPDGVVEITVPANALSTPSRVSISRVLDALSFPSGLDQFGDAYLFSQICLRVGDGATVSVSLPFNPNNLPPGVGTDDLVLVSFPNNESAGQQISSTVSGNTIRGDISSLCEALAIGVPSDGGPGGSNVITFFRANPPTLLRGDSSTLAWEVDVPAGGDFDISITPNIGTVARADQTTIAPEVTTSYTLEVSGSGVSARSELVVEVPPAVGDISPQPLELTATAGHERLEHHDRHRQLWQRRRRRHHAQLLGAECRHPAGRAQHRFRTDR
ncbi:MAG: hypothetical protein U5L04_15295 [Trueperaceae bacterium]|nr:hypothetical protein [Trueperaceae bacterium]